MRQSGMEEARKRMGALLVTDNAQARISRLNVNAGEFAADVMEGYTASPDNALLDPTEVFAVFELAAKIGLRVKEDGGDAALSAKNGRACVVVSFAGLYAISRVLSGASCA
ncbi:MAG: hypothetical protein IJC48_01190 [Clostridia bacterium]|nr:hypothetical protein [Clostridia bacterium]